MDFIYMLKKLIAYSGKEKWKIFVYSIMHIISIVATVAQPMVFAMIINTLQYQNNNMMEKVVFWLFIYVACFYVFEIFHRSARFIELYVAYDVKKRYVLKTYNLLQSLPLGWHNEHHSGNIVSRVNKASDALYCFGQSMYNYIMTIVNFVGSIIVLWFISPVVAIIAVFVGLILVFSTKRIYNLSVPEYRMLNEGFHKISATLQDGIGNITTIILLRLGKCIGYDLETKFKDNFIHLVNENKFTQIKCHVYSLLVMLLNVGLIFYYIYDKTKNGNIVMLGLVTAIFQYLSQLMEAFGFYVGDYEKVIHWRNDFDSVLSIIDLSNNIAYMETRQIPLKWNKLLIRTVDFSYDNSEIVLHNLQICLEKGKKIAFVGDSGSGKSTMLKIIRGIYDVPNCNVIVDDNYKYELKSLTNITTLIPQEPEIFDNTVLYNINMGIKSTDADIQRVLWQSAFDEVIEKLPKGVNSLINENGVNLSGGEKQRLALARGLFSVKDSSIVLFDEPTGSLDAATELKVYTRVFESLSDRCVISVLHRLHLLKLFDYIYVFHNGDIVEHGELDNLINNKGYFTYLWEKYMLEQSAM
ncbi:ABC transporter ATP-binding protein [Sedimentibacter sp. zth1]|uniref:ABC transporter ATP-binding protein n=1 Tax=Sedimentibacter sp. zth1 TaxID=2816908 RepID=UPI001A930E73|nr:ABC transporter ATP-binding protein [Sedimentibacter sp. zth1]QSX04992.1 ABC transporter ATP-binding protein [Sedimentibacter sp. zth1]